MLASSEAVSSTASSVARPAGVDSCIAPCTRSGICGEACDHRLDLARERALAPQSTFEDPIEAGATVAELRGASRAIVEVAGRDALDGARAATSVTRDRERRARALGRVERGRHGRREPRAAPARCPASEVAPSGPEADRRGTARGAEPAPSIRGCVATRSRCRSAMRKDPLPAAQRSASPDRRGRAA